MAEQTGANETQADSGARPQEGASQRPQQPQEGGAENANDTVDATQIQRELSEARREAARYRTEAKKLADEKRSADEAALPERERFEKRVGELTQQIEELRGQLREERGKGAVVNAASAMGFAKPEQAYALVMYERSLDFDDDGRPTNVEAALKALLKDNSNLASAAVRASGSVDQGSRGTTPVVNDMNTILRRAAGRTN